MRKNRNHRGGSRSRGGHRQGRSKGYRRGNQRGGGRGYKKRDHSQQQGGNLRERVQLESGSLVLIDQFMLANPQFIEEIKATVDDPPESKDPIIKKYGGCVVKLHPAVYRIARNPYSHFILVYPDGEKQGNFESLINELNNSDSAVGYVLVDTRCLAMFDRELLYDVSLIEKCNQLWFEGREKACRDLLRDNGGAVRYGFEKLGDEFGVYFLIENEAVALLPDLKEDIVLEDQGEVASSSKEGDAEVNFESLGSKEEEEVVSE